MSEHAPPRIRTGVRRKLLLALGFLSVTVGVIGIFLPVLPTAIFLIAGSHCFARSSPELDRRLREHPKLRLYFRAARGELPFWMRIASVVAIWASVSGGLFLAGDRPLALRLAMVGFALFGTAMMAGPALGRRLVLVAASVRRRSR